MLKYRAVLAIGKALPSAPLLVGRYMLTMEVDPLKQMGENPADKLLSLLLVLALLAGFVACSNQDKEQETSPPESSYVFSNPLSEPSLPEDLGPISEHLPKHRETIAEFKAINSDVVGWLEIPGTTINDVVVWYPNDYNEYYLRKDVYKRYNQAGSYYADFRNKFDGTAAGLSRNTVIYGHSLDMNDSPDAPYFSQLKKFLDQDFAEQHPYIYFSVEGEELVWEVFAVFHSTIALPYNVPEQSNEEFTNLISEVNKRSQYIYDVNVTTSDKILTLSTCVYQFTPGVYPNDYRYVVMAKLVDSKEAFKEKATLEKNPHPKEP